MSARTLAAFSTIRTEGAMLPSDILVRVASGDKSLGGLEESSYHLAPGEKIGEATNRAWNRLQAAWANFQAAREKLAATDAGTSLTRERWLLPLFQLLDYGRLQAAKAEDIGSKSYAISHAWQQTPIHLVGCNVDLDRRTQTAAGGMRSSPHSLLQELLNRSDQHLWGIVSNGLRLRLLRDNISLTRQAYVEFDLEAMMAGEAYPDFVLLWLLLHQSRFEAERPDQCQLEKWSQTARTEGVRVLDGLRDGVQQAIEHLGQGFLAHPSNAALREKLRSGALDKQDYYRQILRLVYRLLFLFVADDRDLLMVPTADPAAQKRYRRFYATTRLRRLATTRAGSRHHDLYCGLKLVMEKLSGDGCTELALPALGSFLFSPRALPDLNACDISNLHLLEAIRSLAVTQTGQSRRVVDYKNLGAEELGSVYESLLELHPDLNAEAASFELKVAAGSERKKTGSYYTPTSLISCLLDSALDPVLLEAAKQPEPEAAILKLKVVDPACGSGHFLIAAAHRIAKRLAAVRTGEEEPPPEAQRKAIRDVIGHCIYGVDVSPMAVELCKVSLWMEALEPGKPLSFLEHRVQSGNSLLGATPSLLARGIPDEAFTPIEGDDKEICKEFKQINKDERNKQMRLFAATTEPWLQLGNFAASLMNLDTVGDDSIEAVRKKERMYEAAIRSGDYLDGRYWGDTWCAAFAWNKTREFSYPITEEVFRRIERNPHACEVWMRCEIERLANQYRFFHWHLAFPDVFHVPAMGVAPENSQCGWNGGGDVVLGNPPWERIQPEAVTFFAASHPELLGMKREDRNAAIALLSESDPYISRQWQDRRREDLCSTRLMKSSGRYPLSTTGNVNSYAVFLELSLQLQSVRSCSGLVLQSGIATDASNIQLFRYLVESRRLETLFDFENREQVFPGIDSRTKFCLITCRGAGNPADSDARVAFYILRTEELLEQDRVFYLSPKHLRLVSPNTGLCPTFRNLKDASLVFKIYEAAPAWISTDTTGDDRSGWGAKIKRIFSMGYDSGDFRSALQLDLNTHDFEQVTGAVEWTRVYEAKLFHQFDHRFATYEGGQNTTDTAACRYRQAHEREPANLSVPRLWARKEELQRRLKKVEWGWRHLLGFRDVARATDERTVIATILPFSAPDDTTRLIFTNVTMVEQAALIANLNSMVLDFAARNVVASTHLSEYIANQFPVLPRQTYQQVSLISPDGLLNFVSTRVLELTYTAWDLKALAVDSGWHGPPFRWNEVRRFQLRSELDALFLHLYGLSRDDTAYILDTFPIVRRKEEAAYGEYRTKRVILEIYDAMAEAERTGVPYQTRLDPPPADSRVAHLEESMR